MCFPYSLHPSIFAAPQIIEMPRPSSVTFPGAGDEDAKNPELTAGNHPFFHHFHHFPSILHDKNHKKSMTNPSRTR
jgi:hypothetical protein